MNLSVANECCEKCRGYTTESGAHYFPLCNKKDCACHLTYKARIDFEGSYVPKAPAANEEVRKRFRERFVDSVSLEEPNTPLFRNRYLAQAVEDFLIEKLSEARTDERSKKANYRGAYLDGFRDGQKELREMLAHDGAMQFEKEKEEQMRDAE